MIQKISSPNERMIQYSRIAGLLRIFLVVRAPQAPQIISGSSAVLCPSEMPRMLTNIDGRAKGNHYYIVKACQRSDPRFVQSLLDRHSRLSCDEELVDVNQSTHFCGSALKSTPRTSGFFLPSIKSVHPSFKIKTTKPEFAIGSPTELFISCCSQAPLLFDGTTDSQRATSAFADPDCPFIDVQGGRCRHDSVSAVWRG